MYCQAVLWWHQTPFIQLSNYQTIYSKCWKQIETGSTNRANKLRLNCISYDFYLNLFYEWETIKLLFIQQDEVEFSFLFITVWELYRFKNSIKVAAWLLKKPSPQKGYIYHQFGIYMISSTVILASASLSSIISSFVC